MLGTSNVRNWLAANPKAMGALCTLALLSVEFVGAVAAGGGGAKVGP